MYPATQAIIEAKRHAGVFPGVIYSLIEGPQKFEQILGYAQIIPTKRKLTQSALFDVASLTKVVCTTTVLLRLWEQGQIEFDQPLKKYLPAFQNQRITLRHLLTHTSDIQTWIPQRDQLNATELRQAYLQLQPGENLGKVVQYTDAGTILLGFMLEEIFDQPVIEVFQREVLTPLQMTDSCFLPSNKELIVATERLANGEVLRGITHDPKARVLGPHAGNAGLFTNLADLSKFAELYLNHGRVGEKEFLRWETIDFLLTDQTPETNGHRSLGWDLKYTATGQPLLFHTGYTGTFLLLDPLDQSAFIFLSNRVHPTDQRAAYLKDRDEILNIYLKEKATIKK